MYNLLEYSKNYRKTTGSLWNYYKDEPIYPLSPNSESFRYKTSITGNTYNTGAGEAGYDASKVGKNETEVVIPLKHSSNFWRSSNILLINCKVELILTWSKKLCSGSYDTSKSSTRRIKLYNNRHKIVCSSRYFVKRK